MKRKPYETFPRREVSRWNHKEHNGRKYRQRKYYSGASLCLATTPSIAYSFEGCFFLTCPNLHDKQHRIVSGNRSVLAESVILVNVRM